MTLSRTGRDTAGTRRVMAQRSLTELMHDIEALLEDLRELQTRRLGQEALVAEAELADGLGMASRVLEEGSWNEHTTRSVEDYSRYLTALNRVLDRVAVAELIRRRRKYRADRNAWRELRTHSGLDARFRIAVRRADFRVRARRNVLAEHPRLGAMAIPRGVWPVVPGRQRPPLLLGHRSRRSRDGLASR